MPGTASPKSWPGRHFEDFHLGQAIAHSQALTVTESIATSYRALTGLRFSAQCSTPFAQRLGLPASPIDDLLVFKIAFGQSVRDVSMHAVATLGYGGMVFGEPVYPGDTIASSSEVIGLTVGPTPEVGIVHVRTTGRRQDGSLAVSYVRWVTVRRRDPSRSCGEGQALLPPPEPVGVDRVLVPSGLRTTDYDVATSGSPHLWDDYRPGERIDHVDGLTIEESESMMVARLYQNTAPPHYNAHRMAGTPMGRRLVFVGHVLGLTRALSYNGLGNVFRIAAINGARHLQPTFPGATLYAWSEVLECIALPGRDDVGALRLRSVAVRDRDASTFPQPGEPEVVLDWDYIGLIPRRAR